MEGNQKKIKIIHGNVAHKVVLGVYLLPVLVAGLVRCFHIDCLDKLSKGIRGQLREGAVPLYPMLLGGGYRKSCDSYFLA